MDADRQLAVLGSCVDTRDFVDPQLFRLVPPDLDRRRRDELVQPHNSERSQRPPEEKPVVDPTCPSGGLLMIRTAIFDRISNADDSPLYQKVKAAGLRAGIATGVWHRDLSLLGRVD
jgi:hypothetical protein